MVSARTPSVLIFLGMLKLHFEQTPLFNKSITLSRCRTSGIKFDFVSVWQLLDALPAMQDSLLEQHTEQKLEIFKMPVHQNGK